MPKRIFIFAIVTALSLFTLLLFFNFDTQQSSTHLSTILKNPIILQPTPTPTPSFILATPPSSKIISGGNHIFQNFNNCGPAALSMALSYYGVNKSQMELGKELRPYQIPSGNNDDKSVTLEELALNAQKYGFISYHRPNGNIDLIKYFINYEFPIIARTWTKLNEDIGHYRIVKGYDDTKEQIIQDDSLQGKDLRYSYEDFGKLWEKFNYEYLVLIPPDKKEIAEAILKENKDPQIAWKKAAENAQELLIRNPNDIYTRFNLSVASYYSTNYQKAVEEFEKVEASLPFRTLWYQIEPIKAYYELGNYEKVFTLTNKVLNNQNRAFSELYLIRGEIYKKQGNIELARKEFEKAVIYNKNLKEANEAIESL